MAIIQNKISAWREKSFHLSSTSPDQFNSKNKTDGGNLESTKYFCPYFWEFFWSGNIYGGWPFVSV